MHGILQASKIHLSWWGSQRLVHHMKVAVMDWYCVILATYYCAVDSKWKDRPTILTKFKPSVLTSNII